MQKPHFLTLSNGEKLAYHHHEGDGPGLIFFGGFMSDMTGTKAIALEQHAIQKNQAFTRFDYSGHGASDGQFKDGTISRWHRDALAILDEVTNGPQIVIGSSMGGWLSLLCALSRPERIRGLILIAPAPDFTERLMWPNFSAEERESLNTKGYIEQPSDYGDDPYIITKALIEDGRNNLLLSHNIPLDIPIHILHGMQDSDVPWRLSLDLIEALTSNNVTLTLVKSGDHRLSETDDIARLLQSTDNLSAAVS